MHHRMPPSKNGWPSLNLVIFPPVLRLVLDDPKQWPPRRLLIKFASKSWKARRISTKSIAEQLGISLERVGSIIHEDLERRKLSAKWDPKCLGRIQNVKGASRLSKIGNFSTRSKWFPLTIGDYGRNLVISLWSGDIATINWVAV